MKTKLYYDCIKFWQEQGVEKEDNLIALASSDIKIFPNDYYKNLAAKLIAEIQQIDNSKKGQNGFLKGLGY